jgi:hypothetical protein
MIIKKICLAILLFAPAYLYCQVTPRSTTMLEWDLEKTGKAVAVENATCNIENVFTIVCWVKVSANRSADYFILTKGVKENDPGYFQLRISKSGELQFSAFSLSGNMKSGIRINDNNWHQLAVSYVPGRMKFYKDGILITTTEVNGIIQDKPSLLTIGADAGKSASSWGETGRLKIFNTVQSSAKVWDLYTNKLANWDLNEGMGITTLQEYGNPVYGMLQGPINTYDNFGVGNTGWLKKVDWVEDPRFGFVAGFNTPGANIKIDTTNIDLKNRFTIACWIKSKGKNTKRSVILSKGDAKGSSSFSIELNAGKLQFYAPALGGNIPGNVLLNDSGWHHIVIACADSQIKFYKDGKLLSSSIVKGSIAASPESMTFGSAGDGSNSFSGNLSRIRIYGSSLSSVQVTDLYNETESAGWDLDEGKGNTVYDNNGNQHNASATAIRWITGHGSSFSKVVNITDAASAIKVNNAKVSLGNRFTIAAWVQAPPSRSGRRVLLSKGRANETGSFSLSLQKGTGNLLFNAAGFPGDINGGFQIDDNTWHHVMITSGDGQMKFYKDRQLVKTVVVKGTVADKTARLNIGSAADGLDVLNGNLSHVSIYNAVKIPEEVTAVVPPAGPALILKRGIVFDRIQNQGLPVKEEWQISANDIAVAKSIGFDHIKILFTADEFIRDSGLNTANMHFVEETVNKALASGLPCVVDLHPEGKFKTHYLGTDTGFVKMLGFYSAFAKYLAQRWTPSQIAFMLMTEPFANKDGEWNRMYQEMVAAVRKEMPAHTLIVSGDRAGNIYAMTGLTPIADRNIYYSFTTYEPYRFGFNTLFGGWRGGGNYWKDISYIPWPASPQAVESRMDKMLSTVKDEDKQMAREDLLEYGKGYFNRQWLARRVKNVNEWNDMYGGDLQVIVAEFGAIDHMQVNKPGASKGVYPGERVQFVHDLRQSFESVGMGWEYWSFNEYFTLLDPAVRKAYAPASLNIVDRKLVDALGLDTLRLNSSIYTNDNLLAWCIVPFDSKKRTPEERAKMLRSLGITKLAYDWRAEHIPHFDEELEVLKKYNIELTGFWIPVSRDPAHDPTLQLIFDLLKRHKVKTQLWCLVGEDPKLDSMTQQQKIAYTAEPVAYIANEAKKIGCTVGLYNHGGWFGEPENQLAIIDYLKMPNVGMVYNFHHAETQIERFPIFFPKILPHLLALNIAGLKRNPGRVVPVGQGDSEAEMMRIVQESAYKGPVGIINEVTDPDAEVGLRINRDGLKKILKVLGDTAALKTYIN